MAKPQVELEPLMSMTFEEVNGYLEKVDGEHPCEACGQVDWRISTDLSGKVSLVFMTIPPTNDGLAFVPISCGVCANTRFFNAINVHEAVAGIGGEDGGEE